MRQSMDPQSFFFSARDMSVIGQAGITVTEIMEHKPKIPGLPPLWSKLTYLMLADWANVEPKFFWKAYREFDELLENIDCHYAPAYIPKNNGGKRALMVPDETLRYHQRLILDSILRHIPISDYACAYRRGYGLVDLAAPHIGHETLIHLDIRDFFSSITEQMVFETLYRETGYSKTIAGLISRLCCYHRHLPQGACTSPALSNICFQQCDEQLAALADQHHLAYTRYSDDLYFSGNQVDVAAVVRGARSILEQHGFRMNSQKTRVSGQHQAQKVTAILVNKKLQVSREYRRKLRQELYYLERFGKNAAGVREAGSYDSYLYQLLGKVTFVLYVDPRNTEFLKARQMLERKLYLL